MSSIHPTAIVEKDAIIGKETVIHPFVMIGSGVKIGENNVISKGASIHKNVTLGDGNFIGENSLIGIEPSNIAFDHSIETGVMIGDNNLIKDYVTVERSTTVDKCTKIGNKNMLMVHTHIAHDCIIQDEVVIANYTSLAGHVFIDSRTFISGACLFHQFLRVGKGVMVGASTKVVADIPPYTMVEGYRGRYRGLNTVGLKRAGFTQEQINLVKSIYYHLYRGTFSQGIEAILRMPADPIRDEILNFLKGAVKRPIVRKEDRKHSG